MAKRILHSPNEQEQPTVNLSMKCEEWLRNAGAQKRRATKMLETARNMRDRAQEMRKPPRLVLP